MDGTQFFYYDGLQPKMSAGKIKEHECNSLFFKIAGATVPIVPVLNTPLQSCICATKRIPLSLLYFCTFLSELGIYYVFRGLALGLAISEDEK